MVVFVKLVYTMLDCIPIVHLILASSATIKHLDYKSLFVGGHTVESVWTHEQLALTINGGAPYCFYGPGGSIDGDPVYVDGVSLTHGFPRQHICMDLCCWSK